MASRRATSLAISSRCNCIASGVALGQDQADRLALFRTDRAEDIGRGGALVAPALRDAFRALAQRRVILFFWPTRASSANQTSIEPVDRRSFPARFPPGGPGSFFKILDCVRSLAHDAWTAPRACDRSMARNSRLICLGRDDDVERLKYLLAEVDKPANAPRHERRAIGPSSTMRARVAAVLARQAAAFDPAPCRR